MKKHLDETLVNLTYTVYCNTNNVIGQDKSQNNPQIPSFLKSE